MATNFPEWVFSVSGDRINYPYTRSDKIWISKMAKEGLIKKNWDGKWEHTAKWYEMGQKPGYLSKPKRNPLDTRVRRIQDLILKAAEIRGLPLTMRLASNLDLSGLPYDVTLGDLRFYIYPQYLHQFMALLKRITSQKPKTSYADENPIREIEWYVKDAVENLKSLNVGDFTTLIRMYSRMYKRLTDMPLTLGYKQHISFVFKQGLAIIGSMKANSQASPNRTQQKFRTAVNNAIQVFETMRRMAYKDK